MNFFLNNPTTHQQLSDDELERLARKNLEGIERRAAKAAKKSCGCCASDTDGSDSCDKKD